MSAENPAPTPAPVAVPEGSEAVDLMEALKASVERARERRRTRPEPVVQCAGHATCNAPVHEHGCYNDHGSCDSPKEHRPEPVVAPLPSEAAVAEFARGIYGGQWPLLNPTVQGEILADYRKGLDAVIAAGYLLVPEDDEDTVRVPRVALIELNAAVMDRKRDLVDAIEEFNDEVRS